MKKSSKIKEQISLWIDIALNDLTTAHILYTSKEYRNSFFLFHQSVEKANKAMALFNGKTEEDLFKYGHNQLRIYKHPLSEKKKEITEVNAIMALFPKVNNHEFIKLLDLQEYSKSIDAAIDDLTNMNNVDLVNISLYDIRCLLDDLYEMESATIKLPKKLNAEFIETLRKSVDWISLLETPEAIAFNKEYEKFISTKENEEMLYKIIKETLKIVNSLSFVLFAFFISAIFTTQHSTLTRYPMNGKNPLKIYTKRLPLVRDQEEIMDVFGIALRKFKRIVNANC